MKTEYEFWSFMFDHKEPYPILHWESQGDVVKIWFLDKDRYNERGYSAKLFNIVNHTTVSQKDFLEKVKKITLVEQEGPITNPSDGPYR